MSFAASCSDRRLITSRLILRTLLIAAGLILPFASDKPAAQSAIKDSGSPDCVASYYYHPEVRLRKLHLVRPDLIPYPIAYDVYC